MVYVVKTFLFLCLAVKNSTRYLSGNSGKSGGAVSLEQVLLLLLSSLFSFWKMQGLVTCWHFLLW